MNATGWATSAALGLLFLFAPIATAEEVTSEKVKAALPALEKLAQQTMKKTGVPGMAIAVVHQDQVIYLKGLGIRQVGKDQPVDADTVFQLASVSKPIASTVVAAVVGDGICDWDDRMADRLPGFRLADPWVSGTVTLRDLLCHRSGLPDHGGDLLEDLGYDRAEVLHRLRFLKPGYSFRAGYAYTNFGYTAGAMAAAHAAGKSWEDLSAEKLYRPLGMKSTSSRFADYAAAKNRAHLHVQVDGKWLPKYVREPDAQSPAGGASSTVRDMAQWVRLQLGGGNYNGKQLIAAKALAETHRPQVMDRPPANPARDRAGFYGLGWNVSYDDGGRVRLSHSGGFALGAATMVTLLPAEQLGIVVLTNGAPQGIPEAVGVSFLDLVIAGKVEKDWRALFKQGFAELFKPPYGTAVDYSKPPKQKLPALPHPAYLGAYDNAYFGELQVVEKDGALALLLGPKKRSFPLQHWDRDVFLYQPAGENAAGLSSVTFVIGPERRATQVTLEDFDADGQGSFSRRQSAK